MFQFAVSSLVLDPYPQRGIFLTVVGNQHVSVFLFVTPQPMQHLRPVPYRPFEIVPNLPLEPNVVEHFDPLRVFALAALDVDPPTESHVGFVPLGNTGVTVDTFVLYQPIEHDLPPCVVAAAVLGIGLGHRRSSFVFDFSICSFRYIHINILGYRRLAAILALHQMRHDSQ